MTTLTSQEIQDENHEKNHIEREKIKEQDNVVDCISMSTFWQASSPTITAG